MARLTGAPQEFTSAIIQLTRVPFEQDLAKATYAPKGSAQVVRDRIRECLELLVDRFQLGGSVADSFLQFRVQARDLLFRPNPFQGPAAVVGQGLQSAQVIFVISTRSVALQ